MSPIDVRRPELLISAAGAAVVLFLLRRRRCTSALTFGWGAALALTLQLATLFVAATVSTGRYPATAVLAFSALVALFTHWLLVRLAGRLDAERAQLLSLARLALPVAIAVGALAIVFTMPLPLFVSGLSLPTIGVGLIALCWRGLRDERQWMLYAALPALVVLYALLRGYTALGYFAPLFDLIVVLLLGAIGSAVVAARPKIPPLIEGPLHAALVGVPLLGVPLLHTVGRPISALFCVLVGLHYGVVAKLLSCRHLRVLALVFANAALFQSWSALGWSDLQLYAVPLGVTMLALIQIYRAEIGSHGCHALRSLVLGAVYALAVTKVFTLATPLQGLVVVPLLCVAGVGFGILLRVRSYVLMGTAFLTADLLIQLLRYGTANRLLGAIFLTVLGLAVVGAMIVFSLERERILRRYSTVVAELRTWD